MSQLMQKTVVLVLLPLTVSWPLGEGALFAPLPVCAQSCAQIYFQANAETGDTSQWTAGEGGRARAGVSVQQRIKHSGNWAFKHVIVNPSHDNQTGKTSRQHIQGTHGVKEAYYSAWYYIESGFDGPTAGGEGWWTNIMQWKPLGSSDASPKGTYDGGVAFVVRVHKNGNKPRELVLWHWACVRQDINPIPCLTFPGYASPDKGLYAQANPRPVPERQWFHLEAFYKATPTNGQIIVWQDRAQIFNLAHPNLNTLHARSSTNQWVYWGIGAYVGKDYDSPQILYVDDVMVTNHPVGGSPPDKGSTTAGSP
jgi:hypothetical protein